MEFELNLSLEELKLRNSDQSLRIIKALGKDSAEFNALSESDKAVARELFKAGLWIDKFYFKLENKHNLEFLDFLNTEIEKGDERAKLTKRLFLAQKSMYSLDLLSNEISLTTLAKPISKNFYPSDLTQEKFHQILNTMLDNGKDEEIKKILSARTVVRYAGNELVGIDYTVEFKEELTKASEHIKIASTLTQDQKMAEYLDKLAKSLITEDLQVECDAEILWLDLKSTLDFTITKESYDDLLTLSVANNPELIKRLSDRGIDVVPKDLWGVRLGIVNKAGTEELNRSNEIARVIAKNIPFESVIKEVENTPDIDLDLLCLLGDSGAFQAGIVMAESLPNTEKLSYQVAKRTKNVYNRQVRFSGGNDNVDKILCAEQLKYYNMNGEHLATICHEIAHGLGPRSVNLGKYQSAMEEFKADLAPLCSFYGLIEAGIFTKEQMEEMAITTLVNDFRRKKPKLEEPYALERTITLVRMFKRGAIKLIDGKLKFDIEKVNQTAKELMNEVISLQIENNANKATEYVESNFEWTEDLMYIADILMKNSKKLNGEFIQSDILND